MAMKQEVNVPLVLTIGAVSALLLLVSVIGIEAWFVAEESSELDVKWNDFPNVELVELRTTQQANISSYHWTDMGKSAVVVPVEEAFSQVIAAQG